MINITEDMFEKIIELWEHRYRYYNEDKPIITDFEYDMLEKELEKMFPIKCKYSKEILPTEFVGFNMEAYALSVFRYNYMYDKERIPII